jgi:hypothetical protein
LAEGHPIVFQTEEYHSETQLAGLLGIALKLKKQKRWKCPFGYCLSGFDSYSEVADHVLNTEFHYHHKRCCTVKSVVLGANHLLFKQKPNMANDQRHVLCRRSGTEIELMPLPKEIADQLWKTGRHKYIAAEIGHIRVLQGSPLEDALHFLRRRASAQTSVETSDMEGQKRRRDESDEEVGDKEETKADPEVQEKRDLAIKTDAIISTQTTPGTTTNTRMEY